MIISCDNVKTLGGKKRKTSVFVEAQEQSVGSGCTLEELQEEQRVRILSCTVMAHLKATVSGKRGSNSHLTWRIGVSWWKYIGCAPIVWNVAPVSDLVVMIFQTLHFKEEYNVQLSMTTAGGAFWVNAWLHNPFSVLCSLFQACLN